MSKFRLACVPVAFKEVVPRQFGPFDKLSEFYREIAANLAGVPPAQIERPEPFQSIPLGFERQRDGNYAVRSLQTIVGALPKDINLLIFDCSTLSGTASPPQWYVLFLVHATRAICTLQNELSDVKIAVMLPYWLLDLDDNWNAIKQTIAETNGAILLNDAGEAIGAVSDWTTDRASAYAGHVREYRSKARLNQINLGALRRLGRFKFTKPENRVVETLISFDGSLIITELAAYIAEFAARRREGRLTHILFHTSGQPWMTRLRLTFTELFFQTRTDVVVAEVGLDDVAQQELSASDAIIIISPLVDTGGSIISIDHQLSVTAPASKRTYLTIFSTSGFADLNGTRSVRRAGARPLTFHYILKRERKRSKLSDIRSRISVPPAMALSFDEESSQFDPCSFWLMATEAGFEQERQVPPGRPSLGLVPKFKELIEANSSWIAAKIARLLERSPDGAENPRGLEGPLDIAILCPKERNAQALAQCLRDVLHYGVIEVPRQAIDIASTAPDLNAIPERINAADWTKDGAEWLRNMKSLAGAGFEKPRILLMDEFSTSGGTLAGLTRLARGFDMEVVACILIVDFVPRVAGDPARVFSLYQIPLSHLRARDAGASP